MQSYKIVYSSIVNEQILEIYKYVWLNFGTSAAENFIVKFDHTIKLISKNPKIGKGAKTNNNIRSLLITKHNRLYYKIKTDSIFVLWVFDTRQNPEKNKFD